MKENLCCITLRSGTWDRDDRSETDERAESPAAFGKLPKNHVGLVGFLQCAITQVLDL